MKPLIGITMNLEVQPTRNLNIIDQDYGRAIMQAGGIPVPLLGVRTFIPDLVKKLDGFLFTGGDDINPRFYREKPLKKSPFRPSSDSRTEFEIDLFKSAVKARKPVLAICHGAQIVNVALGGSLYQDIPLQIRKALQHGPAKSGEKVYHAVNIFEGTRICEILGTCSKGDCAIKVRSSHHQSIKNPGRGLRLAGVAPDGVFEAFESRSRRHFLIAVQWHPEKTINDRYTKRLFAAFVNASRK
ncbi:MAG: gamma-glutamyl-gamma-aminobutyrate hydrolase family protein [Methanothrix sp.]|nr:gamma-glutamyl-gamma-aminobutyrate hydrolase family protein [Methanothrix sp.]